LLDDIRVLLLIFFLYWLILFSLLDDTFKFSLEDYVLVFALAGSVDCWFYFDAGTRCCWLLVPADFVSWTVPLVLCWYPLLICDMG
jgi:hypothetical protein